ncbi:MAG: hypothetical protein ACLTLQ_05730 [[Clostridium] scindens]
MGVGQFAGMKKEIWSGKYLCPDSIDQPCPSGSAPVTPSEKPIGQAVQRRHHRPILWIPCESASNVSGAAGIDYGAGT